MASVGHERDQAEALRRERRERAHELSQRRAQQHAERHHAPADAEHHDARKPVRERDVGEEYQISTLTCRNPPRMVLSISEKPVNTGSSMKNTAMTSITERYTGRRPVLLENSTQP